MLSRRAFAVAAGSFGLSAGLAKAQHNHGDPLYSVAARCQRQNSARSGDAGAARVRHAGAPRCQSGPLDHARARCRCRAARWRGPLCSTTRCMWSAAMASSASTAPYHHVYDPAGDRWISAPLLPRGANHVGVTVLGGKLYAIGGHLDQNRRPDELCFVLEGETSAADRTRCRRRRAPSAALRHGRCHPRGRRRDRRHPMRQNSRSIGTSCTTRRRIRGRHARRCRPHATISASSRPAG